MDDDLIRRVKEIQFSMVESAKSFFDESDLGHLRCLIRLAVEFHDYLEHGSVDIATRLLDGPFAKYVPDAHSASGDPFNKYDLEYTCASIRSGVPSFCLLSDRCRVIDGATASRVGWGVISSRELFKKEFISMFNNFTEEVNFERKCRLLLDLFKLQIVFAGISFS
jgi:hypothetical protein